MHSDEPSPVDGEIVAGCVPTLLSVFRSGPGTQCHLWLFLERQGLKPLHSNRSDDELVNTLGERVSALRLVRCPSILSVQFLLTSNTTPPLLLIL
jgi:hypothetical protein